MNASVVSQFQADSANLGDESMISMIIDKLYDKMLDDYRINRFFFTRPASEQSTALKQLISVIAHHPASTSADVAALLEEYFSVAFARTNAKPSLVNNRDFAFLLDIVGGQEIREITLLCPAHSFLMKLLPEDFHYDVVMEHLADCLNESGIDGDLAARIMAFAESGRDGVLGRGTALLQAA